MPTHIIKNFKTLATTKLRRDALTILESGIRAIDTKEAIQSAITYNRSTLKIGDKKYDLDKYRNVFVVGIGKAAFDSALALEKILKSRITDGIILDVKGGSLKHMKSYVGTHPLPSRPNMQATGAIIGLLKSLDSRDLLITIVSGGGSALLCWPYELTCDELSTITDLLMKKGATIHELNTVRKHLSEIQGGQFARLAHPATVIGLIFSDVPGGDLSMVASGPTFLDTTSVTDAARILTKYKVLKQCKLPRCNLTETPKDPKLFNLVNNVLVVSNEDAVDAMKKAARRLGYKPQMFSTTLNGEASEVGRMFATMPKVNEVIIAAGETTVTVHGGGKGGRNQELALGALKEIKENTLVLSCASDGIDNTPVAGAFVDHDVKKKTLKLKLNPEKYLNQNNSYEFFQKLKTYIKTGITGANVSDLILAIRER